MDKENIRKRLELKYAKSLNLTWNPETERLDNNSSYPTNVRGNFTRFPIKFGKIRKSFDCAHNKLTTLEGGPTSVGT